MANWKKLITEEMSRHDEKWDCVVGNTMSEKEMRVEFDDGWGSTEGIPFTVWTHDRVYFPTAYDGSEGVASVSRNVDMEPTQHI